MSPGHFAINNQVIRGNYLLYTCKSLKKARDRARSFARGGRLIYYVAEIRTTTAIRSFAREENGSRKRPRGVCVCELYKAGRGLLANSKFAANEISLVRFSACVRERARYFAGCITAEGDARCPCSSSLVATTAFGIIGDLYFNNVSSTRRIRPSRPDVVCRQFRRLRRNAEMAHSQLREFGSR